MPRGRYYTIPQASSAYPGVLTERLIRRLVAQRRIAFSYAGRRIVLAEADIEAYLEANRCEPLVRLNRAVGTTAVSMRRQSSSRSA